MIIGGIQYLYIPVIKTDLSDDTISFSAMICSRPNSDFDGDAKLIHGVLKFIELLETPKASFTTT